MRMLACAAERLHTRHFLSAVTFAQPPSAVTLRYSLYRSSSLPPMRGICRLIKLHGILRQCYKRCEAVFGALLSSDSVLGQSYIPHASRFPLYVSANTAAVSLTTRLTAIRRNVLRQEVADARRYHLVRGFQRALNRLTGSRLA